MSAIRDTAEKFFDACESGKGWDGCKRLLPTGRDVFGAGRCLGWRQHRRGVHELDEGNVYPDTRRAATRSDRLPSMSGATTSPRLACSAPRIPVRGPVPPTGKRLEADYVYVMDFDNGQIKHMTKIWNDVRQPAQLGWTAVSRVDAGFAGCRAARRCQRIFAFGDGVFENISDA